MEMTAHEFTTSINILRRHGYECREEGGAIVVRDPVRSSRNGTEHKDVVIRSFGGAIKFVDDRV